MIAKKVIFNKKIFESCDYDYSGKLDKNELHGAITKVF